MSDFENAVARIELLPKAGEGMTVSEIATRLGVDTGTVVAALEEIVERAERGGEA